MSRMFMVVALTVLGSLTACRTPLCPNGNPIPKEANCERTYPAYARAYVGLVSLSLEASGVKLTDVNAGLAADVKKLRQDYDQITNQLELSLKSICLFRNASLCDPASLKRLQESSDMITAKMGQIRQDVSTIESLTTRLAAPGAVSEEEKENLFTLLKEKMNNVRAAAAEATQGTSSNAK